MIMTRGELPSVIPSAVMLDMPRNDLHLNQLSIESGELFDEFVTNLDAAASTRLVESHVSIKY